MKRVIRKGIFETNSSSTHSLSFGKGCPFDYEWSVDDIDEKFMLAIAVIDHALYDMCRWRDNYFEADVKWAIEKLEEYLRDNYRDSYDRLVERYGLFKDISIRSVLYEFEVNDIEIPSSILENEHIEALWQSTLGTNCELVLRFRNKLVEEYLNRTNRNTEEEREKFEFDELYDNGYSCSEWFIDGSLYKCDCGLHDIYEVYEKIVGSVKTDEEIDKRVKEFFSEDYHFFGKEEL